MSMSEISHDPDRGEFLLKKGNLKALLSYSEAGEKCLSFNTVYVDPELRGKGAAGEVTSHALEYALSERLSVIPACPYVDTFIKRNRERYGNIAKK